MKVQQGKRNLFCFGLISLILSKRGISFDMKANKNKTGLIFDNIFLDPIVTIFKFMKANKGILFS